MRFMDDLVTGTALVAPRFRGRMATRDMMTFDMAKVTHDQAGNAMGASLGFTCKAEPYSYKTRDGQTKTVDNRFFDSTGAFMVGELERLDMTYYGPLTAVSWGRDMELREDVTLADEVSSYTVSTFASSSGIGGANSITGGKAWSGKDANQITSIGIDIGKVVHALRIWDMEIKYTIPELASAARLGRPIDEQQYNGLQLKHQQDIDAMVYIGDTDVVEYGLLNSDNRSGVDAVTNVTNAPNGAAGSPLWTTKTPNEILADINSLVTTTWANAAWAIIPDRVLLGPTDFSYIATQLISTAGAQSILKYVEENNVLTASGKGKLQILPAKWANGAGVGGTVGTVNGHNRMTCYTKDRNLVRYSMTPLQRTPVQYDGIWQKTTYYCRLGVVEIVYPETIGYMDSIG